MKAKTQISTDIDYERAGKQAGYLLLPYSHNNSAWAKIAIPIYVIKNGMGPTILALGGNHGDEYEGTVALMKLARDLEPETIQGRVVIIPALNIPAVKAGTRLSPVDNKNLNRSFPGRYSGSVTEMIAHYVTNILFPLSDVVMDIHSGGKSMVFVPCANLHQVADERQFQKMLKAAKSWGAPYVFIYTDVAGGGLLPAEAEKRGKIVVTAEMGGAGECNPQSLKITERGIRNTLIHHGLLDGQVEIDSEVKVLASTSAEDYLFSPADGIYEPFFEVGSFIGRGTAVGQIHFAASINRRPDVVVANTSGLLISRRFPANTSQGDCVATIARQIAH